MSSRHNAISIDLGTTHARVAVFQNDRVHVLVDGGGRCSTPSCVAFTESEIIVGEAALGQITSNVDNTVFNVKRIIGRDLDSQEVQDEAQAFPFKIIAKDGRGPFIQVAFKGNKNTFSPEQICAMLLTKMKEIAEAHLRTDVTTAVITVPDCFNSAQIQATRMAGEIAGLQVLRIMTETSAAAFTYGHSAYKMGSGERNILIFDLGGGHLSVCLVTIDDGVLDVKAAAGDAHLGGEDFDNRLVSWCVQEFKLKHHEDLSGNNRALRRLRTACERAKRTLSSVNETTIEVDALFQGTDFYTKITRAKFEELCVDLFRGTIGPVERVLRDSHISKDSVHEVVLVGGSTRIPKVCQLLQDFFNGKELNRSINPEEAVAYGAAVQAAMLSGEQFKSVQDMMLLAVASISIGIETASGVMAKIADRNSTIPCLKERTFFTCSDKQTGGLLRLLEGECDMAKDNRILGEFHIDGIPPAPPGLLLHVRIDLDANGVEGLLATDKESWGDQKLSVSKIHHDSLLRDGAPVMVHNLTSKPELNSRFGVCERFDDEDGLWVVRLDTNDTVKLHPKNLAVRRLLPPMQDMKLEVSILDCLRL
jgi:heat shock protein 1/8